MIVAVERAENSLCRAAPHSGRPQLLAANVDQALVVFAASHPEPKRGLLDRFLVACHMAGIDAVVVINKIDLGSDEVEAWLPIYEDLGYEVLRVSAGPGGGSVVCGGGWSSGRRSSAGRRVRGSLRCSTRSTLDFASRWGPSPTPPEKANTRPPGPNSCRCPTAVSSSTHRGSKSSACSMPQSVDLVDGLPRDRRGGGLPVLRLQPLHEPDCAVRAAVEDGDIDAGRFASYLKIREEE